MSKTLTNDGLVGSVMLPPFYREAPIVAGSFEEESRSFDIVWTAGAEVPRIDWWTGARYIEVLEVSDGAIRLDRLKSGHAPVLDSHAHYTLDNVMGVVDGASVRIDGGKGYAKVRMSKRENIAPLVSDIRDGIIANVSPGYITHAYREEMREGIMYRVATDWEPMEISFVPVGADPDAGRRAAGMNYPCQVTRVAPKVNTVAEARMRMRQRLISAA